MKNDIQNAAERIALYVARRERKPLNGLGDSIHSIHVGTEWEAELLWSDLKAIVPALKKLMVQAERP